MSLPSGWARLPGPLALIETIADDVAEGMVVVVGVAEDANDFLADEVSEYTFDLALGDWILIPFEEDAGEPAGIVSQSSSDARSLRPLLWVQSSEISRVNSWVDHLRKIAPLKDAPRAFVSVACSTASEVSSRPGVRIRLWNDFVTKTDSLALVDKIGRQRSLSRAHLDLKSAVVATLAGGDIAYASRLASQKLSRIIDDPNHPRDQLWAAQVGVLMPMVDYQRKRLLHRYYERWKVPHRRMDGRVISAQDQLEIGDMDAQAYFLGIPKRDVKSIRWLNRVRRAMAHNEPVSWGVLVSAIGRTMVDFTE